MRTLAEGELELFSDRLQGMRDGVFHKYVSLPSEQITELFVPLVDDLVPRKGTWETISVPSFWHERNVGSSRGFIEANSRAAEAGVTIDRVLVLDADPACLHSWQKRVLRVLFFEAAQHSERMLLKVVRVTDADINAPNFGIWDKQLVVEMDYSQYEGEHVRQFERIDVFTRRQTVKEFRHTFERWKECQMFGIEDVTEEARRIAEKIGEGNVEPPFAAGA